MTQTEWTTLTDRFGPLGVVDTIAQQLNALSKSKSAAKTPVERPAVLAVVHDGDSDKDKDVRRSTEAWQLLMPDLAVHVERVPGVNSKEWTAETCIESMNQGRELVKAFVADNRGMLCVRGGRPSPSSELLFKSLVDLETDAAMTLLASTNTGGEPAVAILCGAILEASTCAIPIVVDGYIAGAAALCARRIAPKATLHALFVTLDEMEPKMSSIVKVFDEHFVAIRTHGLGGFHAMSLLMQAAKLLAAVVAKQDQDDAPHTLPATSPAAAPIIPADATPPPELRIFLTAVMFLTRLPAYMIIPDLDHRVSELVPSFCYFPIIGWGVGGFAAAVLWLTHALFGSVAVAVVLSTFASVWLTGCFHEDGVADTFDSFGGGWSKNDILRIMKDSRLGTYGCMGLLLMTALKFAILTRVVEISTSAVGSALVAGHVLGRYSSLFILQFFVYVEDERDPKGPLYNGIGNNLHFLTPWRVAGSTLFTALSMTILLGHTIGLCVFAVGLLVSYVAGDYFAGFLGGVIGDCLGCANQVVEVVVYLTIAMVHQF